MAEATEVFRPAEVFHLSEFIAAEARARGWTIWDVADGMGGDAPLHVLGLQFYALRNPGCRIGEDGARELEQAFGIPASFFTNMEAYWLDHPEARSQTDDEAAHLRWFEIDDEADRELIARLRVPTHESTDSDSTTGDDE